MYKKEYNKKILIIALLLLVMTSLFFGKTNIGKLADFDEFQKRLNYDEKGIVRNLTEIIYSYITCYNGYCENKYPDSLGGGKSKELFTFYGHEADCDTSRARCNYYRDSLVTEKDEREECEKINYGETCVDCGGLTDKDCYESVQSCVHRKSLTCKNNNPYGQSGTIKTKGTVSTNGSRVFLDGYDNFGFHWIRTGKDSPGGKAIGFKENSREVFFNNNLYISGSGNNISLNQEGNLTGKIVWNGNEEYAFDSEEYIETEAGSIDFHSEDENIMEMNVAFPYKTKIHNGLEINTDLKTGGISWLGNTGAHRTLLWTPVLGMEDGYPHPSREDKEVLFYLD